MSLRINKAALFHFCLAFGLNKSRKELEEVLTIYLLGDLLRQGILQSDMTGESFKYLVAELQANWPGAVGFVRDKVKLKGVEDDDTSQTLVVAKQIRRVVEAYFASLPSHLQDALAMDRHFYITSAILAEAVWEIQMDKERVFAKYLFGKDVHRVTVDASYLVKRGEPSHVYRIRGLRSDLDKSYATISKMRVEIFDLKSKVEVKDNLRHLLNTSEIDEELALRQVANLEHQIREQRKMYEGKLNNL